MIASVYSRRCGSYRMYLEDDSLHQIVIIGCVDTYANSYKVIFSYLKSL